MKERLVELVKSAPYGLETLGEYFNKSYIENCIVQHLLENGVIVPPCKVGDVVYSVFEDDVIEDEIILIEVTESAIYLSTCTERYMWVNGYLYSEMLDRKLYITREQAQAKLKEGGKDA